MVHSIVHHLKIFIARVEFAMLEGYSPTGMEMVQDLARFRGIPIRIAVEMPLNHDPPRAAQSEWGQSLSEHAILTV